MFVRDTHTCDVYKHTTLKNVEVKESPLLHRIEIELNCGQDLVPKGAETFQLILLNVYFMAC